LLSSFPRAARSRYGPKLLPRSCPPGFRESASRTLAAGQIAGAARHVPLDVMAGAGPPSTPWLASSPHGVDGGPSATMTVRSNADTICHHRGLRDPSNADSPHRRYLFAQTASHSRPSRTA
jgi:hypothetical protein